MSNSISQQEIEEKQQALYDVGKAYEKSLNKLADEHELDDEDEDTRL